MNSTPSKILIADDDEILSELLQIKLEEAGFHVDLADDGQAALDKVKTFQPDAIILDGMMPKLDGFDVVKMLKKDPETAQVKVIMLTARGMMDDVAKGLELGVDDYFVKPFMPDELVDRLHKLFS